MRYKRLGRNRDCCLNIPRLTGGLNAASEPTLIGDDELTELCNLCEKDGALTTRAGLRLHSSEPFAALPVTGADLKQSTDIILSEPIEVDGELCVIVFSGAVYEKNANVQFSAHLITLDGQIKREYDATDLVSGGNIAVLPCDADMYGTPFLLYKNNVPYKEVQKEDGTWKLTLIPEKDLYAPLVMINGRSMATDEVAAGKGVANGVMYEGFNMLTRYYRAQFTSCCTETDVAEYYTLPTLLCPDTSVTIEAVVGGEVKEFVVGTGNNGNPDVNTVKIGETTYEVSANHATGRIGCKPPLPASILSGNVTVTCCRDRATDATDENVRGATVATWFGGTQNTLGGTRAFLSGFPKDKAKVCWSDVNNPLYFPENNYMYVGDLSQPVTALAKQDDMLVIFKKREMFYTSYVQGEIDSGAVVNGTNIDVTTVQAHFPLVQLSPYIGCDCPDSVAMCQNHLVWMCADGRVYALASSSPYSECNVREIGMTVTPHILENTTRTQREASSGADVDGQYMLIIGNRAYSFRYDTTGMTYLLSSYSNRQSSARLVWYAYRFDAFSEDALPTLRIVSDGAYRALLIATYDRVGDRFTHVRFLYRFDGTEDSAAQVSVKVDKDNEGNETATLKTSEISLPVAAVLATKTFDFGDASSYKRLKALFATVKGRAIDVSVEADGALPPSAKRLAGDRPQAHRLWCSVGRCQTLTVRMESQQPMTVYGIRLFYTPFGTVK